MTYIFQPATLPLGVLSPIERERSASTLSGYDASDEEENWGFENQIERENIPPSIPPSGEFDVENGSDPNPPPLSDGYVWDDCGFGVASNSRSGLTRNPNGH